LNRPSRLDGSGVQYIDDASQNRYQKRYARIEISMKRLRPPDARLFKLLYAIGLGPLVGRTVLLLTTTGRKTGLPRMTPLQYEEIDGAIYVASARGVKSDWFRNILADPCVSVRVKSSFFEGIAQPVTDPERIADFLEIRLQRHPRMVRAILEAGGVPPGFGRAELVAYAGRLAMVIIRRRMTADEGRKQVLLFRRETDGRLDG
jgi:deazaflavin-dependent oxidoreductase (nitroreductase family)